METQKDEISLKELVDMGKGLWQYLLSKWKIIVIVGIIGAIIGLAFSFIKKPVYTATLTYALEDEKSGGGFSGALGLASSLGFDLGTGGGGAFSASNLMEFFKSRSMVEKTLLAPTVLDGKKISLAEMYIQEMDWRETWEEKPKLKNLQFIPNANREKFSREHDSILGTIYNNLLKRNLTVEQKDKKVAIGTITTNFTNELFAKNFTEALAKQVSDFYIETKSKKARLNMDILVRQRDSVRNELNSSIVGVAVANDNTFNLNPAMNVKRTPSVRRQVDVQANSAIFAELVKQTEVAKVTLRKETPLIQIIDSPILPLKEEKLGKIKGILLGGILAGFLTVLYLILKRIF